MPVTIFGEVDRRKSDKRVISEYPADYFTQPIEELKESIARKERALERGDIPPSEVPYAKQELEKERKRITEIKDGKVEFTSEQTDKAAKVYKRLSSEIQDSMFTRNDMMKGLASAHEEAHRMKDPIIELKTADEIEFAKACNIQPQGGKISRDEATKIWKIIGRRLGEVTNVENLRRDKIKGR